MGLPVGGRRTPQPRAVLVVELLPGSAVAFPEPSDENGVGSGAVAIARFSDVAVVEKSRESRLLREVRSKAAMPSSAQSLEPELIDTCGAYWCFAFVHVQRNPGPRDSLRRGHPGRDQTCEEMERRLPYGLVGLMSMPPMSMSPIWPI